MIGFRKLTAAFQVHLQKVAYKGFANFIIIYKMDFTFKIPDSVDCTKIRHNLNL